MNTPQFIPPVTLDEFRFKFKLTLGKMKKDTKIEYSVVQLHNQFKVVGLITKSPFISTFTIDFSPDIPRRFVECDMPALVLSIKNNFYAFMQSSHNYATPYGNHTEQTVFFYLVQMHIKIMDTINYVPQQQAHSLIQLVSHLYYYQSTQPSLPHLLLHSYFHHHHPFVPPLPHNNKFLLRNMILIQHHIPCLKTIKERNIPQLKLMTIIMNQILNKYKKSAYLSFQLIVHYKHLQINEDDIVLFLDVKNIKDLYYQPIVLTVQKNIDFNKAFQISFMHICEHFNDYSTYATLPLTCKKKKKVTFNDVVQVRLIVEEQFEFHKLLTQ